MELKVLEADKERLKLEIAGEDHTFCNFLKEELWNAGADIAGYNIEHPLTAEPWLLIEGKNPKALLAKAVAGAREISKSLSSEFKKIK